MLLDTFVVRPILASSSARAALPAPEATLALPALGGSGAVVFNGEVSPGYGVSGYASDDMTLDADPVEVDPATRLRRLIEKRQTESIEILRSWMETEEEPA